MAQRKSKPLQRRAGKRPQRNRFLVYMEGSVTESIYLKGVRSVLGRNGPIIELGSTHGEPLGLVRDAISHGEREGNLGDAFEQVWCIFDVESPVPHASLGKAISLARSKKIHCAITNPCFELWLILHFEQWNSWITTEQACRRLEDLPCDYSADSKSFDFESCRHLIADAASRAKVLAGRFDSSTPLRDRNPWVSVQELFGALGLLPLSR